MKHVPFKDPFPIGFQAEFPYAQTGSHEKNNDNNPLLHSTPRGHPHGVAFCWKCQRSLASTSHHLATQPMQACNLGLQIIRWFQVPSTITTPKSLRDFRSTPPKYGGFEDELPLWKGMTVHIPAVFGAGKYLKISSLKISSPPTITLPTKNIFIRKRNTTEHTHTHTQKHVHDSNLCFQ